MSRRTLALVDIKVIVRGVGNVPITASPYYQSLSQNKPEIHEKYVGDKHNEHWHTFKKNYKSIRDHGFVPDTRYPITLDAENVILDGHHRVCILWHLYGQDLLLYINKNNQVYDINEYGSTKASRRASQTPTRSGKGSKLVLYKKPLQTHGASSRKPKILQRKS